ncbi:MAG: TonB family protein [Bacteroidales bacterium]|nr:TonB family protein [Bacteroidales bacterium]
MGFCAAVLAAQDFSVAPALRSHVEALCSEEMEGRRAGTAGESLAARYVHDRLQEAGVLMLTGPDGQDFGIAQGADSLFSMNIVGIVEGSDPELREQYIVVGAHFDGAGVNVLTIDGEPVLQMHPGADANASGVAVMLEVARMVAQYRGLFGRSVIFAGFGAGCEGMAGSWYFVNRAFTQVSDVRAMIDLDRVGRSGEGNPFSWFSPIDPVDSRYLFDQVNLEPVAVRPSRLKGSPFPSDYLPFHERRIPVFLFTTGPAREHNTLKDSPWRLDYGAMEAECNYLYHFLMVLSRLESVVSDDAASRDGRASEKIYSASECDSRPQFFHSDERHFLKSWVYKYLKYPVAAIRENIQGQVLVSFVVETDGTVTNVAVEHGVDQLLDDEAVRVISVSPKWIPGRIKGRKVRTRIVIPVEFRLKR